MSNGRSTNVAMTTLTTQGNKMITQGSEQEELVSQFLKSITPKELRYYSIRDNCGPAALHMMDWAKEKGIKLNRVHGYFVADNVLYDKADFTKEMKHEFLQQGLDFNNPKSRREFIASNPKYSKEWKRVPHYWLQDDRGTVYDPTGYTQFIKTGLAKDLDKSRYETVQGVAEGEMKPTHISGKKISGYVETLEKALLKAKTRGIKLKYNKIDKIMQLISQAHHITGDTLHNDFVKKHHMIPDKWIVKQQIAEGLTKHPDYLSEK